METRFVALARFVAEHQALWQVRPFAELVVPWEHDLPEIATWLKQLPDDRVDEYWDGGFPETDCPPLLWSLQQQAQSLCTTPLAEGPSMPTKRHPVVWYWRIKGRKLEQLQSFTSAVLEKWPANTQRIVDWCAGKGHLGRCLAWAVDLPATFIEFDPILANMGAQLAKRMGVDCETVVADVLDLQTDRCLTPNRTVVALHACGHLGDDLLLRGGRNKVAGIFWAPCCYHRTGSSGKHRYLSSIGVSHGPYLSKSALRLAIADEVVAPDRQRRFRRREQQWRLGWDLLRRDVVGATTYESPGMLAPELVQLSFPEFCDRLAHREGWEIPAHCDWVAYERRAVDRLRETTALSLVRSLFRRSLEMLHVLDRAITLSEMGYSVDVVRFCDRRLTPRDLLIRGVFP
ncbi:MAG: methyltransferase [Myxococcales bacterium]|nr:methyltransferase [Myxococcales bacterium]